jgi:glucose/arabinose dehydrogenase
MRLLSVLAVLVLAACGSGQATSTSVSVSNESRSESDVGAPSLELVAELAEPVDAAVRSGDEALFVVSRMGIVSRVLGGVTEEVLDLSDLTEAEGERGLLGLAFSQDGSTAYVNFTNLSGNTVIAKVDVSEDGLFDRMSLQELLTIEQPYANHNGGDIVVEASGALLVATGDGGSADDPQRLALDDSSLLGKVLRIDPATGEATLIARGLRNPWRIDLFGDDLWIADVGQGTWEEVSVLRGVSSVEEPVDFGWSAFEGFERFNEDQSSANHQPPLMVYEHGEDGCSISGGAVAEAGSLTGRFVFADFCSGKVWSIPIDVADPQKELLFDGIDQPVAIVRAGAELLVLSLQGSVWRLVS